MALVNADPFYLGTELLFRATFFYHRSKAPQLLSKALRRWRKIASAHLIASAKQKILHTEKSQEPHVYTVPSYTNPEQKHAYLIPHSAFSTLPLALQAKILNAISTWRNNWKQYKSALRNNKQANVFLQRALQFGADGARALDGQTTMDALEKAKADHLVASGNAKLVHESAQFESSRPELSRSFPVHSGIGRGPIHRLPPPHSVQTALNPEWSKSSFLSPEGPKLFHTLRAPQVQEVQHTLSPKSCARERIEDARRRLQMQRQVRAKQHAEIQMRTSF